VPSAFLIGLGASYLRTDDPTAAICYWIAPNSDVLASSFNSFSSNHPDQRLTPWPCSRDCVWRQVFSRVSRDTQKTALRADNRQTIHRRSWSHAVVRRGNIPCWIRRLMFGLNSCRAASCISSPGRSVRTKCAKSSKLIQQLLLLMFLGSELINLRPAR
jgi:hypothetical protein